MAVAHVTPRAIAMPRQQPRAADSGQSSGFVAWIPLAGLIAGILGVFYLAQTSELTNTGYSRQEAVSAEGDWRLRNEQLSLEIARARSLSTIEAEATKRLLMVPPKDAVYLRVSAMDIMPRATPASRGDARSAPELQKSSPEVSAPADSLDHIRSSLSTLLAPIYPQPPR